MMEFKNFFIRLFLTILFVSVCLISFLRLKGPVSAQTNSAPIGFFDYADCDKFAGWTCDADDYSQPLYVHFYIDGPAGTGTYLFNTVANTSREVAPACGGIGSHGFYVSPPTSIKDGKPHTIYAYAINVPVGVNPLLGSKLIQCQASAHANGDAQISTTIDGSPLVLKTCDWAAGAVCSIKLFVQ
jgi:hypothetical protein